MNCVDKALDYIQNPDKTDGKMLVSSFGCSYETADIEFAFTLSQALDKGNNLAHHLIQSFEPGEVNYEKAHEIGRQLADAVTKGQHEYVLTTHIDKGHKLPSLLIEKLWHFPIADTVYIMGGVPAVPMKHHNIGNGKAMSLEVGGVVDIKTGVNIFKGSVETVPSFV